MAGACGRAYRVDPRVDPAPCNALEQTASGLLVPRTVLAGLAPGGNVGASRSVDIDVTDTGGANCPDTWQIGGRLTPISGEIGAASFALPLSNAFNATGAAAVLPEPGVYEVTVTGWGQICAVAAINTNMWITLGLQIDGQGVIWSDLITQHQVTVNAGTSEQSCVLGQGAVTRRVQTAGGITVRAVAALSGGLGAGSQFQSATFNNPYLSWTKISD
jgi:hypothetical protein